MVSRKTGSVAKSSAPMPFHWAPMPEKTKAVFFESGSLSVFSGIWLISEL